MGRHAIVSLAIILLVLGFTDVGPAEAQSPFGVSTPQAPVPVGGDFLRENLSWIYQKQAEFYKELTAVVKRAKEDGTAVWGLILLSFLYGVFHAAGPGHGKIVISSYMLANEQTLKRGVIISFLSAFMQGLVAVTLIGLAVFLFKLTNFAITETTQWVERLSFFLIAALGAYLLWDKGLRLLILRKKPVLHDHGHHHHHGHAHDHDHHHHHHEHDEHCGCGGHMADPKTLKDPLSIKTAFAAVLSVGLRPCSGALIVLVFAAAQGLFWVGVVATFAMSIGTAITVSLLAFTALGAKGLATRYLSVGGSSAWAFKTLEILGASLLLLLGVTLFAASMVG